MKLVSLPTAAAVALLTVALATACGSGDDKPTQTPTVTVDRAAVLVSLADRAITPAYESAAAAADKLSAAVSELVATPDAVHLQTARDAWVELRLAWSGTLAFDFGPTEDRRTMSLVDWSPVDPDRIEQAITSRGDSITADDVSEFLASSQRGLGAVEYVLFSSDDAALTGSSSDATRRLRYLSANVEAIDVELRAVAAEWSDGVDGGSAYRDVLTGQAAVSISTNAGITQVTRGAVFLLQDVADMELAPALGLRGGGVDLSGMPSLPSGSSRQDIRRRLVGAREAYVGSDGGMGLSDIVGPLSSDTDSRLRAAFDDAIAKVDAISLPIDQAVAEAPDDVQALFDSVKAVQQVLNTEVVSLLGVSIGFSDNDGDSSN